MVVSLIEIFLYHKSQLENEMKLNIAEKEKAVYQFETLKNQINPHFLFNSLNVLSSLAYQDAEKANLFAKKLSSVYRYLLATHERETVTLQEEMQFVDSYLYLEKYVLVIPCRSISSTIKKPRQSRFSRKPANAC